MKQELTVEVAAARQLVWDALVSELGERGDHVEIRLQQAPDALQLVVRPAPGERYTLGYRLEALGPGQTAVAAAIEPAGPRYLFKRLLSFGAVDRGYLDALAVGLANLQAHLESEQDAEAPATPEGDTSPDG